MARKKASLGTTPRRSPALRAAASVRYANTGGRSLRARPDLGQPGLVAAAGQSSMVEPINQPARPDADGRDEIEAQLCQLVGPHSRVLVIGRDTWPLSRTLSSAECRVAVVETRHDAPAGSATFSERVVVGDPDSLNLDTTLHGQQFDAIVAVRLLEHVRNPVEMLTALGKRLSAGGRVVAAVPNVTHGRIRLWFLAGRSPAGLLSADAASPSHWYDGAGLRRTFERAGFVITRLERHIEAFDADTSLQDGTPVPPVLVEGLRRDADAMTRTYVVVAHTFPLTGQVRLELEVSDLAQSHGRVEAHAIALEQRADRLDGRYDELKRGWDGMSAKVDSIEVDLQLVAARDSRVKPLLNAARQRVTSGRLDLKLMHRDLARFQYELMVSRVRTAVEAVLPQGAVALVASKGDEQLVGFNGRTGWHFLRNDKGQYAGYYPADSAAAVEALQRLRSEGASYLVFPQVAFWWLDHYAGLRDHLDRHARVVTRDERTAVIYALDRKEKAR